ncbi:MAG: hypothetical protein KME17_09870 [Cyanosarcina radialis HA8281-LM2]|nr:hypothetical protein [Cyanosarcina radialis HA8281-LM2]
MSQNQPKPPKPNNQTSEKSATTLVDKFLPSFERLQSWWNVLLQKVRALLPESTNQKLSDLGLTGIIAGIIVLFLWIAVAILSGGPSSEVAKVSPTGEIQAPPELQAPKSPKSVKVNAAPTLGMTPEQKLIASIQKQVAETTKKYGDELVRSFEANFQTSQLTLKVSDDWYTFDTARQDELADRMLNRSQKLNFNNLEIFDSKGTLLARSPVVGQHMVVLQREANI